METAVWGHRLVTYRVWHFLRPQSLTGTPLPKPHMSQGFYLGMVSVIIFSSGIETGIEISAQQ